MSNKLPTRQHPLSKIKTASFVVASILSGAMFRVHAEDATVPSISEYHFPSEVAVALKAPDKAILYSLEPLAKEAAPGERTLHGSKIIGQLNLDRNLEKTVAAQFNAAVAPWDGTGAGCFNPRHALTVTSGGKTYDILLCYECGEIEIFRGKSMIADMRARGTGETLNAILAAHKVPLSSDAMEPQD